MQSYYRSTSNRYYYKKPFYKSKGFLIILIIVISAVGFIYWSIKRAGTENVQQNTAQETPAPRMTAKLIFLEGQLKARLNDEEWRPLAINDEIPEKTKLRTEIAAKAILELPDKSQLRMSENSEIMLSSVGMADIIIEQSKGNVFHRVNDQTTAIYRVRNAATEVTALGTAFNFLASGQLTYATVTENKVKVKIYGGDENVVNMRTVEAGTKALINPNQNAEQMIQTEEVTIEKLLNDGWYVWNLEEDRKKNFFLGIFEKALALSIIEPAQSELTVDQSEIKIKGKTEPEAEIFLAGKEVENNKGGFETTILLSKGENTIEIVAKKGKNLNKRILKIISTKEQAQISLQGSKEKNKIKLQWNIIGAADDIKEFKILQGAQENPIYPNAIFHSADKKTFTDEWENLATGTYHFRVCALSNENKCLAYSNDYKITIDTSADSGKISLSAKVNVDSVNLNWNLSEELSAPNGFKTVIAKTPDPIFPSSAFHSLGANERNDSWKKLAIGKYYFRVCLLADGGKCALYSDNATAEITEAAPSPQITLSGNSDGQQIILRWDIQNLESPKGFKIVMDDKSGVVFPGRDHHLLTSSDDRQDIWINLTEGKTYYFRACENLGSACRIYSNEIEITF